MTDKKFTLPIPPSQRHKVAAFGLPWIRPEDYAAVRGIMLDGGQMPPLYEEWLKVASRKEDMRKAEGLHVIRVIIDPAEFPRWCSANGYPIGPEGRIAFATIQASRQRFQN